MKLAKRIGIAALAVAALGWVPMMVQAHGFPGVKQVFVQPLAGEDPLEVRVLQLDFSPGSASPKHRHPGHTIVHVLEGKVISAVDDGPEQVYGPGESFYEPPNSLHAVGRNASATEPAKAIAFMIIDKEKPSTVLDAGQ